MSWIFGFRQALSVRASGQWTLQGTQVQAFVYLPWKFQINIFNSYWNLAGTKRVVKSQKKDSDPEVIFVEKIIIRIITKKTYENNKVFRWKRTTFIIWTNTIIERSSFGEEDLKKKTMMVCDDISRIHREIISYLISSFCKSLYQKKNYVYFKRHIECI